MIEIEKSERFDFTQLDNYIAEDYDKDGNFQI